MPSQELNPDYSQGCQPLLAIMSSTWELTSIAWRSQSMKYLSLTDFSCKIYRH